MKPFLTSMHHALFRNYGELSFEGFPMNFPLYFEEVQRIIHHRKAIDPSSAKIYRDLWRDSKEMLHMIVKKIAPLLLELTGEKSARLIADHFFIEPMEISSDHFFGFSPLLSAIGLKEDGQILFLKPGRVLDASYQYYVLFGEQNTRYVENSKDPFNHALKKEGYAFNDQLKNETHPLIFVQ